MRRAYLVLHRREREQGHHRDAAAPKRQQEWLLGPGQMVGIGMEACGRPAESYEGLAFREAEHVVAKALGRGLSRGLHTVRITNAELETGLVQLELAEGLLEDFREFRGKSMIAYTARENDMVSSTIVYGHGQVQ